MPRWGMIAAITISTMRLMTSGQCHQSMMAGLEAGELRNAELKLQRQSSKPSSEKHQKPEAAEVEKRAANGKTAHYNSTGCRKTAAATAFEKETPCHRQWGHRRPPSAQAGYANGLGTRGLSRIPVHPRPQEKIKLRGGDGGWHWQLLLHHRSMHQR